MHKSQLFNNNLFKLVLQFPILCFLYLITFAFCCFNTFIFYSFNLFLFLFLIIQLHLHCFRRSKDEILLNSSSIIHYGVLLNSMRSFQIWLPILLITSTFCSTPFCKNLTATIVVAKFLWELYCTKSKNEH